jgi:acyl-CoA reductase-like NAD-dependent aldehyde dehydrogenase
MKQRVPTISDHVEPTMRIAPEEIFGAVIGIIRAQWIIELTTGRALNAPFGGFKGSSANTFTEQRQAAVDFYTRTKTIYVNYE